ncbi:MAG TPA: WD40 repeat domain-containing protein, partial [Bryobacteraceae bacterium]|nr:WD40 repeat domain-containing protein [Bryobacteraceae bacterium]
PATTAVAGWAADGTGVYTGLRLGTGGNDGELYFVSATTGESKTVATFPGRRIWSVQPEPGKNTLLISVAGGPPSAVRFARIVRLDLSTGKQTELIPEGAVSEITFSPDATQVAAIDRGAKSASILVKPLEGGEWKTLATLQGSPYMFLNWAPNGDLLFGKEGSDSSIFRLSSTGGTPQKIADLKSLEHVHEIRIRPDGRQLIFQSVVNNIEFWALENFLPKEFMQP